MHASKQALIYDDALIDESIRSTHTMFVYTCRCSSSRRVSTLGNGAGQMDIAHDNPRNRVPRNTERTKDREEREEEEEGREGN